MKVFDAVVLLLSGSFVLSACSSNDDDGSVDPTSANSILDWQSCDSEPELQCTTLEVLSNPDNAQSKKITLALNRLPSTRSEREGIVLINPGGPGGSGIELLEEYSRADSLPQSLRERFDFIGFDPRGVGGSTAVSCSEFGTTEINKYLATEQSIDLHVENLTAAAASCEQKYGMYLQQLGSLNVVHDMDAIRDATAEEKLHFIGYSYGTRLGALYLQTYPENSGHILLDGSLKPEPGVEFLVTGAVEAMQASLVTMLAECRTVDPDCSGDLLLDDLENKIALLAENGREDELNIITVLLFVAAENSALSPFLLQPLYEYLQSDDISELQAIYQNVSDDLDNDDDTAERAVMCADDASRPTANELKTLLASYNQLSDIYAEIHISQAAMCSGWPVPQSELLPITTNQAPAALVIGGTTDTLTLASWAEEMAQSIGGFYLESNHIGHTVVFSGASLCVDSIAEDFLLTGFQPVLLECTSE